MLQQFRCLAVECQALQKLSSGNLMVAPNHLRFLSISPHSSSLKFLAIQSTLPVLTTFCTMTRVWYATICRIDIMPVSSKSLMVGLAGLAQDSSQFEKFWIKTSSFSWTPEQYHRFYINEDCQVDTVLIFFLQNLPLIKKECI